MSPYVYPVSCRVLNVSCPCCYVVSAMIATSQSEAPPHPASRHRLVLSLVAAAVAYPTDPICSCHNSGPVCPAHATRRSMVHPSFNDYFRASPRVFCFCFLLFLRLYSIDDCNNALQFIQLLFAVFPVAPCARCVSMVRRRNNDNRLSALYLHRRSRPICPRVRKLRQFLYNIDEEGSQVYLRTRE